MHGGLTENVGIGTVSPEDIAAHVGGDSSVDGVEQVYEREGEVHEGTHTQNALLIGAAAGPGEHNSPQGAAVLQCTGEHVAAQTHLIVLVLIQRGGNADAQELVAHGGVAEQGGQQSSQDQRTHRVQVVLQLAEQSLHAAAALQRAAVSHGQKDQVDGPHGVVHAAAVEQLVGQLVGGLKGVAVVQDAEQLSQAADALEDNGEQNAGSHREGDTNKTGQLDDTSSNNHQDRQQNQRIQVEALFQSGLQLGGYGGIIVAAAGDHTQNGIQNEGDHKGGSGCGHHGGHVVKQAGLGHSGGQVGGVRQRRELVAHVGTGDNHTGGDGGIDAQASTDAEHGDTDGSGSGPGGAAGQAYDGTQDTANGEEKLGSQKVKSVINEGGNSTGHNKGGNQETYGTQDQNGLHGGVQSFDHAGQHVGKAVSADAADDAGHHDGNDQRHVSVVVDLIAEVQAVDHQAHHDQNRQKCLKEIREPDFTLFCIRHNILPFLLLLLIHIASRVSNFSPFL